MPYTWVWPLTPITWAYAVALDGAPMLSSVLQLRSMGVQMPIWDHLEELRERVLVGALAAGIAVLTCFAFSKDLVVFLEAPVASQGVRFLQLSPGEFFFTTLKVRGGTTMPGWQLSWVVCLDMFEPFVMHCTTAVLNSNTTTCRWRAMLAFCWQHPQSFTRLSPT